MESLSGKTIAVTGAASGIGRCLALALAKRGANVALADRDAAGLAETVRLLGNAHQYSQSFDVTEPGALEAFVSATETSFGHLDGIINNAGLSVVAPFEHTPREDFARVMAVNFEAVVEGCRVALPRLKQRSGKTWLVNISSVFGIMPYQTQSAYCASKFAVKGFTETLRMELAHTDPHISVVCVHPGGIKTPVARNAKFIRGMDAGENNIMTADKFDAAARTTPEAAAEVIIKAMERNTVRVRIGYDARIIDWLIRLMPKTAPTLLARIMGA